MIEYRLSAVKRSHRAASPAISSARNSLLSIRRHRRSIRVDAGGTRTGWLRSRRRGVVAGGSASALHITKVDQCYAAYGDLRLKSTPEARSGRALRTGREQMRFGNATGSS